VIAGKRTAGAPIPSAGKNPTAATAAATGRKTSDVQRNAGNPPTGAQTTGDPNRTVVTKSH